MHIVQLSTVDVDDNAYAKEDRIVSVVREMQEMANERNCLLGGVQPSEKRGSECNQGRTRAEKRTRGL